MFKFCVRWMCLMIVIAATLMVEGPAGVAHAQQFESIGGLNVPRTGGVLLVDPQGLVHYIGGDRGNVESPIPTHEAYLARDNTWQVVNEMPVPVTDACGVTGPDGRLYVVGGVSEGGEPVSLIQIYDPIRLQWLEPVNAGAAPGQACAATVGADGRIYVFGGTVGEELFSIYKVDRGTVSLDDQRGMPLPLAGHGAETLRDGRIYVFGGLSQGAPSDMLWIFNPLAGDWSQGAKLPFPRVDPATAQVYGRYLVVAGGGDSLSLESQATDKVMLYDRHQGQWLQSEGSLSSVLQGADAVSFGTHFYVVGGVSSGRLSLNGQRRGVTAAVAVLTTDSSASNTISALRNRGDWQLTDLRFTGDEVLADIDQFDAIIAFTVSQEDGRVFGDLLADYVDAGGGVVEMPFANFSDSLIEGRWRDVNDLYSCVRATEDPFGSGTTTPPLLPSHPVAWNVEESMDILQVTTGSDARLDAQCAEVIRFEQGHPFAAVRDRALGRVALAGFHPEVPGMGKGVGGPFRVLANSLRWALGGRPGRTINVAPRLVQSPAPRTVAEGTFISLSVNATDDNEDVLFYSWDLDANGTFETQGQSVRFTGLDGPALVPVAVRISDDLGGVLQTVVPVSVINQSPTISDLNIPATIDESAAASLSVNAVDAAGPRDTLSVSWSFGDGDSATGATQSHVYDDEGVYTVGVNVTDEDGGQVTASAEINVVDVPPTLSNLLLPPFVNEGQSMSVRAQLSKARFDVVSVTINWGDGSANDVISVPAGVVSETINVSHTFNGALTSRTITITAVDDDNTQAQVAATIAVNNVAPVIDTFVVPGNVLEGQAFSLSAEASDVGGDSLSFAWDFGDGNTGVGDQPLHTYSDDGTFTVLLTVSDGDGASATRSAQVVVGNVAPTLSLLTGDEQGDEGALLSFSVEASDVGDDPLSFVWSFGDGAEGSGAQVTHRFADDGVYTVAVTVNDGDGGLVTSDLQVSVANVAPVIGSLSAPGTGDEGQTLVFNASATDVGVEDGLTFAWDFGDGTMPVSGLDQSNVQHIYADDGTYTLTLTVTDGDGGEVRQESAVEVSNLAPQIEALTGDFVGIEDEPLSFSASVTDAAGPGDPLTYVWDFGDGSQPQSGVDLNDVTHSYNAEGSYTLTLTVTDGDGGQATSSRTVGVGGSEPVITELVGDLGGVEGQALAFSATAIDPNMDPLIFTWNFGDGDEVAGFDLTEVSHTYADDGAYELTLEVSDGQDIAAAALTIQVTNGAPVITSLSAPDVLGEGDEGNFRVTVSDPGGDPISVLWDFGDGQSAQGANVQHTYADDGVYEVTVTVSDEDGGRVTGAHEVTVNNIAPLISPLMLPNGVQEGGRVSLSATVSDPGADELTYTWDFGDGQTRSGVDLNVLNHTYVDDGTFTINLSVSDGSATSSRSATLSVANVAPTLSDLVGDESGVEGDTLSFSASASDPGADTLTWIWDFGDGTAPLIGSALTEVSHEFEDAGVFTVSLTVRDGDGGQVSDALTVTIVNGAPVITSFQDVVEGDEGASLSFSATAVDPGEDVLTYTWDFGDGSQPRSGLNLDTLNHIFTDEGAYEVTLTVSDGLAEISQSLTAEIANVAPTLQNVSAPEQGEEGQRLSFSATAVDPGQDTLTFSWDFGDGGSAQGTSVQHTYADDGLYDVTVTVSDGDGGQSSEALSVEVVNVAPRLVSFEGPDTVVEGSPAAFALDVEDTDADTVSIAWVFEQGPTLSGPSAAHTYADDGVFEVSVEATDEDGGVTSEVRSLEVLNADPVIVSLTGDFVGAEGATYNFQAQATDPGQDTLTFTWSFGDGQSAQGASVRHIYALAGEYTLRLEVSDEDGGLTTTTRTVGVAVGAPIITGFGGDTEGVEAQAVSLSATAVDPTDDPITYTWSFGDGSPSESGLDLTQVSHVYADDGVYEVTLTVSDGEDDSVAELQVTIANAPPAIASLNAGVFSEGSPGSLTLEASDPAGDADPLVVRWDFGDGSDVVEGVALFEVSHTYALSGTVTASVDVEDGDGGRATRTIEVEVANAPPVITAVGGDEVGLEGDALNFTVEAVDPGGEALRYSWALGDREPIETLAPELTFTFDDDEEVSAEVTVIDASGQSATAEFTVQINNAPPVIEGVAGSRSGLEGEALEFRASISDPGVDVLSARWDFGDGSEAVEGEALVLVEHLYEDDGEFTLTLTVTDDDGGEVTFTDTIEIVNQAPEFLVIDASQSVLEGSEVVVRGEARDPGGDVLTFAWDFGDGSDPVQGEGLVEVAHTYADQGEAQVTMTVSDDDGAQSVATRLISVLNAAPFFVSEPPTVALADQEYVYEVLVDDPGEDDLSLSLVEGPDGMVLQEGTLRWTPSDEQVNGGTSFEVELALTDGDGGEAAQRWSVRPAVNDQDGDGLSDDCERAFGLDPEDPDDAELDNDRDGLTNREECQAGTDPTTFNGPSAPIVNSPEDNERVATTLPVLKVNNARDPDNDPLIYTFDLFRDRELIALVASYENIPEGFNTTSFTIQDVLEENQRYCWRARAADPFVSGPFSEPVCFVVDTLNDPPSVPSPLSPVGGADVARPTLEATAAVDPEGDDLRYFFEVYDGDGSALESLVFEGSADEPSLAVDVVLGDGLTYSWRVAAEDALGARSAFSEVLTFTVDTSNSLPGPPSILSPEDGAVLVEASVEVVWRNAVDLDGDALVYEVDVATDAEFTEVVFNAIEIAEQPGETGVAVPELEEDVVHHVRVRAFDGRGAGNFDVASFRVNGDNEPPSAPVPESPEDGALVEGGAVELVVRNASDGDGDALTYTFTIFGDDQGGEPLLERSDVEEGEGGRTSVTLEDLASVGGAEVFWSASATDELGATGPASPLQRLVLEAQVEASRARRGGCATATPVHRSAPWGWWWVCLGCVWVARRRSTRHRRR